MVSLTIDFVTKQIHRNPFLVKQAMLDKSYSDFMFFYYKQLYVTYVSVKEHLLLV